MKTLAAILVEPNQPLVLEEIEIPPLGPGQVLVKIRASGVCHTQLLECRGRRGNDPYLPHCLGHEGSGVVLDIGPGVSKVAVDSEVILSWIKGSGADVPGTVYDWNGRRVNAGGVTTFSHHAVVSENRLTPLPPGIDFRDAALLGCAVPTGFGAVRHAAHVRPGESVVIFGVGGVGLCAVAGAAISGAYPVIAVDIIEEKLLLARSLGATHTIDARNTDPVEAVQSVLKGPADAAIEATGRPAVMAQALAVVRPQGGRAVVIGNAPHGDMLTLDPGELNQGKNLLGTWGGDNDPDQDFPRYASLVAAGHLPLTELWRVYPLTEVEAALADLEAGQVARPLLVPDSVSSE
ncbi:MAG: zinc-binding dehydrogenase [Planctomycetota bacterium]|nr:zinc-binding dehydrogenase [Planctomycetota bacterium]